MPDTMIHINLINNNVTNYLTKLYCFYIKSATLGANNQ